MKRVITVIVIFCITLSISSCASLDDEAVNIEEIEYTQALKTEGNMAEDMSAAKPIPTERPTYIPRDRLTYEQALEDYDYFCYLMDNSYPYGGVLERKYGISLDTVKRELKEELDANKDNMNLVVFTGILNNAVLKFNGLGHFCLLNFDMWQNHRTFNYEAMNNALNNKRTKSTYRYFYDEGLTSFISQPNYNPNHSNDNSDSSSPKSFSMDILDGDIAYIRIPSMEGGRVMEAQGIELKRFYSEIAGCENLIIDITGNGGGNDLYWLQNIVAPIIKEKTTCTEYFFVKDCDINRNYVTEMMRLSNKKEDLLEDLEVSMDIIESLPQINHDDLRMFSAIYKTTRIIVPLEEEQKPFEGNIYLLIDGRVYSSAESFTKFCRGTGFATIVGKNTGGDGGGMTPFVEALPNSGLVIRYTLWYMLNNDGACNVEFGTSPDYPCVENESPLDACLRIIAESK